MDLIEKHQTPFAAPQEVHHLLGVVGALAAVCNHGIRRDDDARAASELVLALGREDGDVVWVDVGPLEEFLAPLHDRHGTGAQYDDALLDGAGGRDAYQRLTGAAWQDDDAALGPAVAEHVAQTLLLVGANLGVRAEVNLKIRVYVVISEVIFFQDGIAEVERAFLDRLDIGVQDLKGMDGFFIVVIIIFIQGGEEVGLVGSASCLAGGFSGSAQICLADARCILRPRDDEAAHGSRKARRDLVGALNAELAYDLVLKKSLQHLGVGRFYEIFVVLEN